MADVDGCVCEVIECPVCFGTGSVLFPRDAANPALRCLIQKPCPVCLGSYDGHNPARQTAGKVKAKYFDWQQADNKKKGQP